MIACPLALEGWVEFSRLKTGLRPARLAFGGVSDGQPGLEALLYVDRRGRVVLPKFNAYVPLEFRPTTTHRLGKAYRRWFELGGALAEEMRLRGIRSAINLPPEVADARPWQWQGFRASVRYTFHLDFPLKLEGIDHAPRKKKNQAEAAGYSCCRTRELAAVIECLRDTEERQGFSLGLRLEDLLLAAELVGEESFRTYVCYAPDGTPASSRIVLHHPGWRAVDWIAGARRNHLQSGVTQLTIWTALRDLQDAGASGFDFAGADIPGVAASKMTWGGRLAPYYRIESYGVRMLALWFAEAMRFVQARRALHSRCVAAQSPRE